MSDLTWSHIRKIANQSYKTLQIKNIFSMSVLELVPLFKFLYLYTPVVFARQFPIDKTSWQMTINCENAVHIFN